MIDELRLPTGPGDHALARWRAMRERFDTDAKYIATIARDLARLAAEEFANHGWREGGRRLLSSITGLHLLLDDGTAAPMERDTKFSVHIRAIEEWRYLDLDETGDLTIWIHDPDDEIDIIAIRVIKIVGSLMAFERMIETYADAPDLDSESTLVEAILTGTVEDDEVLEALEHCAGFHSLTVGVLVAPGNGFELGDVRLAAARCGVRTLVGRVDGCAAMILCEPDAATLIIDELSSMSGTSDIHLALGAARPSFADLAEALQEAVATAARIDTTNGSRVHRFDDLGVFRLFRTDEQLRLLESFVSETIGPLLAYDAEHATDLTTTLDAYLRRNSSMDDLARSLHIHRSTLLYRLKRIRELLGIDIDDPVKRVELALAASAASAADLTPPAEQARRTA